MPRETIQITVASLLAGAAMAVWSSTASADTGQAIAPALKCEALANR
jgi:hypothetical protein